MTLIDGRDCEPPPNARRITVSGGRRKARTKSQTTTLPPTLGGLRYPEGARKRSESLTREEEQPPKNEHGEDNNKTPKEALRKTPAQNGLTPKEISRANPEGETSGTLSSTLQAQPHY